MALILVSLGWVLLLFGVALLGERRGARFERAWPAVYALSLAVYCTAWTFYGTVTQAARWGAWLPPTFLGTIALFWLGGRFLRRLAALTAEQHSASIADLIATRFGRDSRLAATITAVALIGIVPYIALQLKAVAMSYTLLAQTPSPAAWQDAALWVTLVLAAFALLFGTREAALTAHNRGLILAMGFESLFKLLAILAVGVYAVSSFEGGVAGLAQAAAALPKGHVDGGYVALIGLGALAMFTLPHQFHLGFVELRATAHLRTARWLFPLYLLLIALPTLPLAWAGQLRFADSVASDLYVLALPREGGAHGLALLAFLGGLSAATGMVILASLTLSIMLASHWLAPWRLKQATRPGTVASGPREPSDLLPTVLRHRRIGVVLVLLLAYLYSRAMGLSEALADIGALSFSALAQLGPAVVAAVYWPTLPARAVFAGIVGGFLAWTWLLLLPMAGADDPRHWLHVLAPGPWLTTLALDPTARGVLLSLAINVLAMWFWRRAPATIGVGSPHDERIGVATLAELAQRFLPAEAVQQQLGASAGQDPRSASAAQLAGIERLLAQVVGATSARVLIDAVRRGRSAPLESVATLVGETSAQLRFNQQLLEAALQNMSQGISVVDAELKLVAWNRRYATLFGYPPDLLEVGTPVADLVAFNSARGLLGSGAAAQVMVERRLQHMQAGTPYVSERVFPDGTVVEIRGNPMPGGGFVATFTDVTAFRQAERELKEVNETLEVRVAQRTAELAQAKAAAERADQAKSRFLAAVSHDLAQPLHAAHLFTHALAPVLAEHPAAVQLARIADALGAAENQLAALLDISRLDAGGLHPQTRDFALRDLTDPLAAEFALLAREAGLKFRYIPSRAWVHSDPQLLRRILQNLLSNAVRYTREGRVLLGSRRRVQGGLDVQVLDTGPGIAEADQALIFEEFRRLDRGGPGLGLGLAIADRIARLLEHPLALESRPGHGTCFALRLRRVPPAPVSTIASAPDASEPVPTRTTTVLVVDNDPHVLAGMHSLLLGWGYRCLTASQPAAALQHLVAAPAIGAALLDLHLDHNHSGFELLAALRRARPDLPAVIITADHSDAVRRQAHAAECGLLHKPLKPLALRSWLRRLG